MLLLSTVIKPKLRTNLENITQKQILKKPVVNNVTIPSLLALSVLEFTEEADIPDYSKPCLWPALSRYYRTLTEYFYKLCYILTSP